MTRDHAGHPSKGAGRQDDTGTELPHERDQSVADPASSTKPIDPVETKAFDDAATHRPDTSLGPVTDKAYRKLKGG